MWKMPLLPLSNISQAQPNYDLHKVHSALITLVPRFVANAMIFQELNPGKFDCCITDCYMWWHWTHFVFCGILTFLVGCCVLCRQTLCKMYGPVYLCRNWCIMNIRWENIVCKTFEILFSPPPPSPKHPPLEMSAVFRQC